MIDTFALGEQVRKDPKLTMKKKEEVKVHLNSLTARWDRVKDFLALRNERFENIRLTFCSCHFPTGSRKPAK